LLSSYFKTKTVSIFEHRYPDSDWGFIRRGHAAVLQKHGGITDDSGHGVVDGFCKSTLGYDVAVGIDIPKRAAAAAYRAVAAGVKFEFANNSP
jgi:hypothetical protein